MNPASPAAAPRVAGRPTSMRGTVERVSYCAGETGWTVARLKVPGRLWSVTIVGTLPTLAVGEQLAVHGRWATHPRYGEQFQVETCEQVPPVTLQGIERYLGSGWIKGIGPAMAKRLVAAFGVDTLQIIGHERAKLAAVPGIGPQRQARITRAWAEHREVREVMIFLQGHGVSPGLAGKIFRHYGARAVAAVRENPYGLTELWGVGFLTADKIARSLGIAADSPRRAAAGLLHVLGEQTYAGHVYVPVADLTAIAEAAPFAIPVELHRQALATLAAARHLTLVDRLEGQVAYLTPLYQAELGVARRLTRLLQTPASMPAVEPTEIIATVEAETGISLSAEQRHAVDLALRHKLLVLTGAPGTGKTTILRTLIRLFEAQHRAVALASPTGRAAKRLADVTGREASTIHRLLGYRPGLGFERTAEAPLAVDALVVDEMSMVDLPLFFHLLEAVPQGARLVLVGDADQLPSVGPGSVLTDLLACPGIASVRLTTIYRQAAASRIVRNAHRINRGEMPDLGPAGPGERADFQFVAIEAPGAILERVVDLVARQLPAAHGVDPRQDIQVLTPMHRGPIGAQALNGALQAALNPPRPGLPELVRGGRTFRVGDRVMQIRNNYQRGPVFNGDLGRVVDIDTEEHEVLVQIDGAVVRYAYPDLDELVHAYATTIHKSQGSEFPIVVAVCSTQHYILLVRNLLYTAITRAKRHLVLVGTAKALAIAARTASTRQRHSGLPERLAALTAWRALPDPGGHRRGDDPHGDAGGS